MAAPERKSNKRVLFFNPLNIFFLLNIRKSAITIAAKTALYRAISLLETEIRRVKTPMVPKIAIETENNNFAGYFCFTRSFSSFLIKTGIEDRVFSKKEALSKEWSPPKELSSAS